MSRPLVALLAVALVAAACSDPAPVEPTAPTTTETTTTTTTVVTSTEPPATTTTTTSLSPATGADGEEVALLLRTVSVWDGEVTIDDAATFVGVNRREGPDAPLAFTGSIGPASDLASFAMPIVVPAGDAGRMPRTPAGLFVDGILPAFVDDEDLTEPLPFDGHDTVFLSGVGISGTSVSVPWEVVEFDDAHVVVRTDHDFNQRDVHRGAAFTSAGNVTGEFRVGRRNPLDVVGRLDIRFQVTSSQGSWPAHQWWDASRAPTIDASTWTTPTEGIERFVELLVPPAPDPDLATASVGYGGRAWSGTLAIEQTWTQLDREPTPTTVRSTLGVESVLDPAGQWIRLELREWDADGPPFGPGGDAADGPMFSLVVAPDGRIGDAYPRATDELDTQNQREWFGRVFTEALPALPAEQIGVGAQWQTRRHGESEDTGPIYTVTAIDPRYVELDVSGDFGAYIGDRYDGYQIAAEIDGTLRIDRQAAIPLDADIEMNGTVTFAVGGEPDPTTTEPWRSTFTVTATPAAE